MSSLYLGGGTWDRYLVSAQLNGGVEEEAEQKRIQTFSVVLTTLRLASN